MIFWAGVFSCGVAVGLAISARDDHALTSWCAAQLVTSLWPWTVPQTREWEARAWWHWEEAEGSRVLLPPLAVPELPRGAKPADLHTPFVVRGLSA